MKRKLTCTNYFIILEKKIFKRANPNANVWASPDVTFGLWDINPPPPESQLACHIYCVKYENTLLTCKRISWDLGGGGGGDDVLKIFFYFLYI